MSWHTIHQGYDYSSYPCDAEDCYNERVGPSFCVDHEDSDGVGGDSTCTYLDCSEDTYVASPYCIDHAFDYAVTDDCPEPRLEGERACSTHMEEMCERCEKELTYSTSTCVTSAGAIVYSTWKEGCSKSVLI